MEEMPWRDELTDIAEAALTDPETDRCLQIGIRNADDTQREAMRGDLGPDYPPFAYLSEKWCELAVRGYRETRGLF